MQWEMFWAGAYIVPAIWNCIMAFAWILINRPDGYADWEDIADCVLIGLCWPLITIEPEDPW